MHIFVAECPVKYNGSCFIIINGGKKSKLAEHQELCAEKYNGHLANIYSQEHNDMVNSYGLKRNLHNTWVWTGMTWKGPTEVRNAVPTSSFKN